MEPAREIMWNVHWMRWPIYGPAFLAFAIAAWGFWKSYGLRIKFIRSAQPDDERKDDLPGRFLFGLRYMFGHQRILRDLYPGSMHFFLFFGMLVLFICTLMVMAQEDFTALFFGVEFLEGPTYLVWSLAGDLFGILLLVGTCMALVRRYVGKPRRLDSRPIDLWALLLLLALVLTGFVAEALRMVGEGEVLQPWAPWSPLGWLMALVLDNFMGEGAVKLIHAINWQVHMVLAMVFIATLPWSKFWHMVPGMMNVVHYNKRHKADLPLLTMADLEDENRETFGIHRVDEFTWKDLLDTEACMRCGRCTDACPAFNTDKPLNPKQIIQGMKANVDEKIPLWLDGAGKPREDVDRESTGTSLVNGSDAGEELPAGALSYDELWACTNCRACQEACPVYIEHVPKIQAMRQYLSLMMSDFPKEAQPVMKNLENNGNPWGIGMSTRGDWAEGLDLPTFADKPDAEYLFYPGCSGSFDERNKRIARATARILLEAGVSFAVLGSEETCCGDPARRIGNEYLFAMLAVQNIEVFKGYEIKKIITPCPHCFTTLGTEYRRHGGEFELVHHSQLIARLVADGRIHLKQPVDGVKKTTYHDSCYLGRWNDIYDPQRAIIDGIPGASRSEMPRHGTEGWCCGAGGGRLWMEETIGKRINWERIDEAIGTGADTLVSACPFCMIMLGDGITGMAKGEDLKLKDIAELVLESMDLPEKAPDKAADKPE